MRATMGRMERERWDADERGRGIASGEAFVEQLTELTDLMGDPGWVAEEPDAHLLPHLKAACDEPGSPLRLDGARSAGEIFVVDLSTREPDLSTGRLRSAAITLAASFAEESTNIRQRRDGDVLEFDIATGTSPDDARFAPHGHLVRLRVHHRTGTSPADPGAAKGRSNR
jgi:hypothetical protein